MILAYLFRFYFHYLNKDGITYMSLCESNFPKETAFIFLEEICSLFFEKFTLGDIERESAYSSLFSDNFTPVLKDKMKFYNNNPEATDNLRELKKGVLNYRDNVMKANDILIERGERITLVVQKADSLRQESGSYYSSVSYIS